MRPHRHHHLSDRELLLAILEKLECVERNQGAIYQREGAIMATLDDLVTAVGEESTLVDSIAVYTQGIRDQLKAALSGVLTPEAQAKIDAVFTSIQAQKPKIAQAMVDGTPAADVPVDQPPTA